MKKLIAVVLFAALAAPLSAQQSARSRILKALGRRAITGQYIVVLKNNVAAADFEAASQLPTISQMANDLSSRHRGNLLHTFQKVLKGFTVQMTAAQAEALAQNPSVAYVEQDSEVTISATQTNATWGLDRVDQRSLPLNMTYTYNATGAGVKAYIIDTGIRATHTQFQGRVSGGFTAVADGNGTNDCNGHGTHVAGTVGGSTYGVAKGVTLVPVRVLGCNGSGSNSGVIQGVDWVSSQHNPGEPAVANMSLGGGVSTALDNAVTNSINDGVVYAVAAGNSSADACTQSPSRVAAALTVGASDTTDTRSSFSNFGTCLDVFAPGSGITSAWFTNDTATSTLSGTSMASPHVAGAVALYLEGNPTATAAIVVAALKANATPNKIINPGTGSPNLLLYSLSNATVDQPPTAAFTFSCTGLTCSFNGSTSTDDNGISSYSWNFGDGSSGTGVTTSRTYAAGGTFQVVLTVTDTSGKQDTETKPVTVTDSSAPCTGCTKYSGSLSGTGAFAYQPNGTYYQTVTTGAHQGWLRGPATADYDLYLQKWTGSTWANVASSTGTTSVEQVSYNGTAGYYRWVVYSYRGSGAYDFWLKRPQ